MSKLCGNSLSTLAGRNTFFTQIVFLEYDDGPTLGALRCASSPETYVFNMLAKDHDGQYDWQAWDRGEEIRIFSLAPLADEVFEEFAHTLSQEESRRRIIEDEGYFAEVRSFLDRANAPEFVIATYGINSRIIAVRKITEIEIANVKDWFSFLGLAPKPPGLPAVS